MTRSTLAVVTVLAVVASACASSSISESEFEGVVAERDELAAEQAASEADLAEAAETIESLSTELTGLRDETAAEMGDLSASVESLAASLASAEDDAAAARADADALRLKYDAEIRAELEAEVAAESARACVQAKEEYERAIASIVIWSPEWEAVTTRTALIEAVEDCSAAERAKTAEQRETERLKACETIDVDALEKNPDAYRGECIHLWAYIVQYDTNTSVCTFRAEMSATKRSRWWDYDGNAMFSGGSDSICPELDDIDNNDFVEIWATGNGTLSYDTQAGGTATATLWTIEKIDLWKKD